MSWKKLVMGFLQQRPITLARLVEEDSIHKSSDLLPLEIEEMFWTASLVKHWARPIELSPNTHPTAKLGQKGRGNPKSRIHETPRPLNLVLPQWGLASCEGAAAAACISA